MISLWSRAGWGALNSLNHIGNAGTCHLSRTRIHRHRRFIQSPSLLAKSRLAATHTCLVIALVSRDSGKLIQKRNYAARSSVHYRPKNTQQAPFNERIKALTAEKKYAEATAVFEEMTNQSVAPDETTFLLLALAMAHINPRASMEYLIRISDQYSPKRPQEPKPVAGKGILKMISERLKTNVSAPRAAPPRPKIGYSPEKREIDDEALEDESPHVTFFEEYNTQLSGIFKAWVEMGDYETLLEFMSTYHTRPRMVDVVLSLEQCIKHQKPEEGWTIYEKWKGICASPQVFHLAVVLNAEQVCPDVKKSIIGEKEALNRIHSVNMDLVRANQMPSYQTQAFLLRHWGNVGRDHFAFALWETMQQDPHVSEQLHMSDYNSILNLYAKDGRVAEAEALFENLRNHPRLKLDASIYTTMVKVYARALDAAKAWSLVGEMVRHGHDPAIYARHRGVKKAEIDVWPTTVTMSILLDMEARVNGPAALIQTFEAIRETYHLTPSLNNWGALLEQLALQKEYVACFDWFIAMMRTQSLQVTLRECCYLTLLDPSISPPPPETKELMRTFNWNTRKQAPLLTQEERRKWISAVYRWKDLYLRNHSLNPPPELDLNSLNRIKEKLLEDSP